MCMCPHESGIMASNHINEGEGIQMKCMHVKFELLVGTRQTHHAISYCGMVVSCIHWIVRPKIILPIARNPTPTMACLALEIASFSFAADSFARIASTFLKISALRL